MHGRNTSLIYIFLFLKIHTDGENGYCFPLFLRQRGSFCCGR